MHPAPSPKATCLSAYSLAPHTGVSSCLLPAIIVFGLVLTLAGPTPTTPACTRMPIPFQSQQQELHKHFVQAIMQQGHAP